MGDVFFLIFGIIVALVGFIILYFKIKVMVCCREKVIASITSVSSESHMIRGSTLHTYRPNFSYTYDGKKYKGSAPFTTVKENKYNKDEPLEILIDRKNPELYRFRGRIGMLISGTIIFAIGLLFVILYFL